MYKIGELSQLSQVPIRTLRYYDQIGVLVPAHVERPSGYRTYSAEQFETLNRILVFKDLGLSLHEIRMLLADNASTEQIRELVRQRHAELERRVEVERRRLARAAARLDVMARGRAAIPEIVVRVAGPAWIASVRATLRSHGECDRLLDELGHHARGHRGHRGQRQRGAIWHTCASGAIDCEVFEIIPERVAAKGRIGVRQLPAQRIASLIYRDDVDYMPAYRTMRAWLGRAGLEVTGPKRELFLRGSPSLTEIQFPIGRADPRRST